LQGAVSITSFLIGVSKIAILFEIKKRASACFWDLFLGGHSVKQYENKIGTFSIITIKGKLCALLNSYLPFRLKNHPLFGQL
jgi:hypothetical protein